MPKGRARSKRYRNVILYIHFSRQVHMHGQIYNYSMNTISYVTIIYISIKKAIIKTSLNLISYPNMPFFNSLWYKLPIAVCTLHLIMTCSRPIIAFVICQIFDTSRKQGMLLSIF